MNHTIPPAHIFLGGLWRDLASSLVSSSPLQKDSLELPKVYISPETSLNACADSLFKKKKRNLQKKFSIFLKCNNEFDD